MVISLLKRFSRNQKAKKLAEEMGINFLIVECTLDEEIIKQRLAQRLREQGSISDGRWEILEPQKRQFEPVIEVPPQNHVIIDTLAPMEETIRQVLEKIDEKG